MKYLMKAERATRFVRSLEKCIVTMVVVNTPIAIILPSVGVYPSITGEVEDFFTIGVIGFMHLIMFFIFIRIQHKINVWCVWVLALILSVAAVKYIFYHILVG